MLKLITMVLAASLSMASTGSAQKLTIAAYHDGATTDDQHINCMNEKLSLGNQNMIQ